MLYTCKEAENCEPPHNNHMCNLRPLCNVYVCNTSLSEHSTAEKWFILSSCYDTVLTNCSYWCNARLNLLQYNYCELWVENLFCVNKNYATDSEHVQKENKHVSRLFMCHNIVQVISSYHLRDIQTESCTHK